MVARLQAHVEELKQELVLVTGEQRTDDLNEEEQLRFLYSFIHEGFCNLCV